MVCQFLCNTCKFGLKGFTCQLGLLLVTEVIEEGAEQLQGDGASLHSGGATGRWAVLSDGSKGFPDDGFRFFALRGCCALAGNRRLARRRSRSRRRRCRRGHGRWPGRRMPVFLHDISRKLL